MVRQVQLDNEIPKYTDGLVAQRKPEEIGILIGRSAGGKDYVLQLVTCPNLQGASPITASSAPAQKAAGAKGKAPQGAAVTLDAEWIVEHAAQVSRLLPGGLDVLGVYVFCPDACLAPSSPKLTALLKDIAKEAATPGLKDLILLHIDSVTGKCSAKELSSSSLKPCDVKPSALVSNMTQVCTQYPLTLRLTVGSGASNQALSDALDLAVEWENKQRVQPSLALTLDGVPLASGKTVGEMLEEGNQSVKTGALFVDLACPAVSTIASAVGLPGNVDIDGQRGKMQYSSCGEIQLNGCLDCRAWVHKREAAAAAAQALKADILRSLKVRVDMLVEAIEATNAAAQGAPTDLNNTSTAQQKQKHPLLRLVVDLQAAARWSLPRRAFVTWSQHGGAYWEYLMEGEGTDAVVERLGDLVGRGSLNEGSVECREEAAGSGSSGRGSLKKSGSSGASSALACNAVAVGAMAIAGLAALVGYMSIE